MDILGSNIFIEQRSIVGYGNICNILVLLINNILNYR